MADTSEMIFLISLGSFTLDGSSHQTEDAAFDPATPQDFQHPRAITDSQQAAHGSEINRFCFIPKDIRLSQTFPGSHITPFRQKIDAGDVSLLMGSIN
jgi:hypothetical protein